MSKTPNKSGGGAKTNANGLLFEQGTSLDEALKKAGYRIDDYSVFKGKTLLGMSVPKYALYRVFLVPNKVDYSQYNSKRWLPDECFINYAQKTAYIIEKKYQSGPGSVDEKLATFQFKREEYEKLFSPLNYKVEYLFVLNDWFKNTPQYRDYLQYMEKNDCKYYFERLPLDVLGL